MDGDGTTAEDLGKLAEQGESALSTGHWDAAAVAYEALVRGRPGDTEPRLKLARVYDELGRVDDLVELLGDPSVAGLEQAKRRLVSALMKAKRFAAALPVIDDLLVTSPDDPKLTGWKARCQKKTSRGLAERIEQGEALVSADRLEEAETVYLALLADYPDVPRPYLHLGQIYLRQNRWADAIPTLRAGLALQPANPKIRRSLARAHFKQGEPGEAVALLEGSDAVADDREALFLLQRSYVELHYWPRVAEVGARLLALMAANDPERDLVLETNQDALIKIELARIDAVAEAGDVDQAVSAYRSLADRHPDSVLAGLRLGTALADAGKDSEAADSLRSTLIMHPENMDVRKLLTQVVTRSSNEDEILGYAQDAVRSGTADFECLRWLARYHADRCDWLATLENAQKAIAVDPDHASTRVLAIHALVHLRRFQEALDGVDALLSLGVKQAEALQLKADILIQLGRTDDAIDRYREALEAAPRDPPISYSLSRALLMKGDFEGFHRFHEKRRELPGFVEAENVRALKAWNGELAIEGKLLIWSEPLLGLGQNIMHMAFLNKIAALGPDIVLQVEPRLVDICRASFPDIAVIGSGRELPAGISHHCPVGSLSRWLMPDLASFDRLRPYLMPDADSVAKHRVRLQAAGGEGNLLIGLCWRAEETEEEGRYSIPLDPLLDAVAAPGVTLVNLEDADRSQEIAAAEASTGKRLAETGMSDADDITGLAAVIAAMDVVVCVDHPVAHLAGAIGTPAYVLLPTVPSAHWLARGDRALWYPGTELVRRDSGAGDWAAVLNQVGTAIRNGAVPKRPVARGPAPLSPDEIEDAVRAYVAQGPIVHSAFGSALDLINRIPPELRSRELEKQRGLLLARFGQWESARTAFTGLRSDKGHDPEIDREILSLSLALRDLEFALPIARKLAAQDPAYEPVVANILHHLAGCPSRGELPGKIRVGPLYFPAGETHFTQFGAAVEEYGQHDRDAAYAYVKRWRRALDVGANVGIFARDFATRFQEVVAFEPVPRTTECLELNIPPNVSIEPFAIADQPGVLEMYPTVENSGGSFICNHPDVMAPEMELDGGNRIEVPVRTIDSYDFDAVDLIKLDIQGAEYPALVGARETILRHRPVIMVEEKPASAEQAYFIKKASRMLRDWGMVSKEKVRSDRVFVFED